MTTPGHQNFYCHFLEWFLSSFTKCSLLWSILIWCFFPLHSLCSCFSLLKTNCNDNVSDVFFNERKKETHAEAFQWGFGQLTLLFGFAFKLLSAYFKHWLFCQSLATVTRHREGLSGFFSKDDVQMTARRTKFGILAFGTNLNPFWI